MGPTPIAGSEECIMKRDHNLKRRQVYNQRNFSSRPLSSRRAEKSARNRFIVIILLIVFLGYASLAWILPTVVGGLTVLNRFKSTSAPEKPVSESATLAPPVLNIPYEATNTATISIKGYSLSKTNVEIYIDNDLKDTIVAGDDGSFASNNVPLNLGTNNIYGKSIDDKGNKSFASKPIKIFFSNEKPKLELKDPQDNQTISGGDKKVNVSGTTDQTEGLTITINGLRIIVGAGGNFSQTIDINEGDNTITVTATDMAGNSTQLTRKVIYKP